VNGKNRRSWHVNEEGGEGLRGSLAYRGDDLVGDVVAEAVEGKDAKKFGGKIVAPDLVSSIIFDIRRPSFCRRGSIFASD
jgi:hypothetical protein